MKEYLSSLSLNTKMKIIRCLSIEIGVTFYWWTSNIVTLASLSILMDRKKGERKKEDRAKTGQGCIMLWYWIPVYASYSNGGVTQLTRWSHIYCKFTFLTPKAIQNRTSKSRWLTGTPPLSCFFIMKLCTVKSPAEYDEKGSHESLNLHSLL